MRGIRRPRRAFYSIDTFSYCHVSLPLIPILSAPKPPRMPPEAMPTHMPIMKPIFTLSKQDGCPPPCMAPCGTGMLVWKQAFILIFKICLKSLSRSATSFAHRLTLLFQRGGNEKNHLSDCQRRLQIFQVVRKTSWQYHLLFLEHSLCPGLPLFYQSTWPKMRCGGQTFT